MNIGKYQQKLSDWMRYKRYSEQSVKAYVSCIGKFLQHFEKEATKPSEISAEKIKKFLTGFTQPNRDTLKQRVLNAIVYYDLSSQIKEEISSLFEEMAGNLYKLSELFTKE